MEQFRILNQSSIRMKKRLFVPCKWLVQGFIFFFLMFFLGACSLPVYKMLGDEGQAYKVVSSETFKHLWLNNVYFEDIAYPELRNKHVPVIVFIEGDGVPWDNRYRIAFEPTSDDPLLIKWFLAAKFPAIYLGRPCYFDLNDKSCSAYWYTHGRYSEPVVTSLINVINERVPQKNIVLVGHSGGATLALLMAQHLKQVKAIVTIAGNLNVKAWIEHHQYATLVGSLDPSTRQASTRHLWQEHYYSPLDTVIKAEWIKAFSMSQNKSKLIELPAKGHSQAWNEYQTEIMQRVLEISAALTETIN